MAHERGTPTRRGLLAACGAGAGSAALLAACGQPAPQATGQKVGDTEVVWSLHFAPEDTRAQAWQETWRLAEQATGVKITSTTEVGADRWTKRQAEFAAGSTAVDVMGIQLEWAIAGGLAGIFVDHYEYMRRDKFDPKQLYKSAVDSWSWKGKQYAVPYQAGGEVVLFNKALFDAKGVKHPHKNWTYDDLLDACRRLNDPQNNRFAVEINQNGLHYMMGTFVLNFGGRLLNEARDRALYGDDPQAIRGAELDVDLHVKYRYTPTAEAIAIVPQGKTPMEIQMVAMEFNGNFRHANVRPAIGAQNLDFAPPPKGPTGVQTASVGGNAWSIMGQSKAKEAAWQALKWIFGKDGIQAPWVPAVSWPASIAAGTSRQWLDQFKGTHIADCARVWETGGHDLLVLPEGVQALTAMNTPMNGALRGAITTREALRQSATELNELFGRRPPAWK